MANQPPSASHMFGDAESPLEVADRFETYKSELNKSMSVPRPVPGTTAYQSQGNVDSLEKALGSDEISKALSPELVTSVRNALAQANIGKAGSEWTVGTGSNGNPVAGGLVAFDLEAPAKLLTPRPTPLRNRIARRRGIGLAHRFKRITGFTGTGTGGVGVFFPGITEGGTVAQGTQFNQGGYTPLRGAQISYAGDDQAVNYKQYGVSDSVSWAAQFSGQGYQDVRQLSQTALLWSSMLLEERMLLGARGTDSGFSGALAAPTGVALAARAATGAEVANSADIANLYVYVAAVGMWGNGAASSVQSTTGLAATTSDVVDVTWTDVPGALGYMVFAGTTTGVANAYAAQISGSQVASAPGVIGATPAAGTSGNKITINFTGGGTGGCPNSGSQPSASDGSAFATAYDGILSYCTGSNSGYVNRLNNSLVGADSANVGNTFSNAFASLYDSVKADPDEILANGHDRKQVSDQLKDESSASYRITLDNATQAHNAQIGTLVTGVQNEVTGKMVNLTVHPWLPQGNMPIISWSLPLPDSNVSDVFAVYNVQDYMGIEWPVNQFLYESSSYWYGTMVCYAPAWCGAIQGIWKA